VRVEQEKGDQGLVLVYVVQEKPSIIKLAYKGNSEVSSSKIKEVVDIRPLSVLDISKIKKNVEKIKELYVEKGFFLVEVDFELKELKNNYVSVTFVINEHAKIEIKRISFIGNLHAPSETLVLGMETREGGSLSFLTSEGTYKEEGIKRDTMRIADYYYNHGYLNVKVLEPIVEISRDRKYLFITIPIEEGEKYRIGSVTFSGDLLVDDRSLIGTIERAMLENAVGLLVSEDLEKKLLKKGDNRSVFVTAMKMTVLQDLLDEANNREDQGIREEDQARKKTADALYESLREELMTQLKKDTLHGLLLIESGEVFRRADLGQSMFKVRDTVKNHGYAYAEVTPGTKIDAENRIVDLDFKIQKGHKVFIEKIEIKGNFRTRDKVIRRQLRVYEGEYYSGTDLEKSKRYVTSLGFFEDVNVSERQGSGADRIVLTFEVKERQTGTFQIGAGFSSIERFIFTAQIMQQNLFGSGTSVELKAQMSGQRQIFTLQYVDPYFLDTRWYFAPSVFNQSLDYGMFRRDATGGRLTLGYWFTPDWRMSLSYKLEDVGVDFDEDSLRHLFNDGWTSSVEGSVLWDTRDNRLFPTDGHFLQGSVEWASPYTLSENHYLRMTGTARYYYPLLRWLVLKGNLRLGYMLSTSDRGLPIFEKYFVGGIYSVRGYKYRSLTPVDYFPCSNDPLTTKCATSVGGNKQVIGNLELEFLVFPQANIKGVLFLDAGNAFGEHEGLFDDRYDEITNRKETFAGLYWSFGFGFRWISPMGPLRFEWGVPLTKRPEDEDMLFEFTIGNFF
jgi:outer membrane protein assembly factor BamA